MSALAGRVAEKLEWPLIVLSLLVIPALLLEDHTQAPELQRVAFAINWTVWLAFCLEFACLVIARPSLATLKRHWLSLAVIVVSPPFLSPAYLQAVRGVRVVRGVRALRLLRLARATFALSAALRLSQRYFRHSQFHLVAVVATLLIALGAVGGYIAEGNTNPNVHSFGDALWWAVVTATTVGYGDVSPSTLEGRVIAVALMLTGIGVIGVFTATLASFFFEQDARDPNAELLARLEAVEQKLDELLRRGQ
jgi:voltage-gated potassium channel